MPTPTGEPQTPPSDDPTAPRPAELRDLPRQPQRTSDATPADDEPFVALLKHHFPQVLSHPSRWLDRRPNPTIGRTGLSQEDAHQNALVKLLVAHRKRSAPGQTKLEPAFVATSIHNAITDLWRRRKREHKVVVEVEFHQTDESAGDANQPDDLTDGQLRAAVLEHRWHLSEPYQQVVDAVFDPAASTQKAIAERVGRSPGWLSTAVTDIGNTVRQCLLNGECPGKE
jgi:RNA polymerase sigma factor (sigma-70 family)